MDEVVVLDVALQQGDRQIPYGTGTLLEAT